MRLRLEVRGVELLCSMKIIHTKREPAPLKKDLSMCTMLTCDVLFLCCTLMLILYNKQAKEAHPLLRCGII